VLSNSWSHKFAEPDSIASTDHIISAIGLVRNQGGAVVVFSSGNEGEETVRDIKCDDGGDGGGMLSTPSNPSDDMVTVTFDEDYSPPGQSSQAYVQTSQDHPCHYYLYDLNYQLIREFTTDMQTVQIPTHDLKEGFYILHVVQGEKVYKAKIEVRH